MKDQQLKNASSGKGRRLSQILLVAGLSLFTVATHAQEKKKASSEGIQNAKAALMKVLTVKDQPSAPAPSEYFIGKVRVTRMIQGEEPSNLTCGHVEFEAGARSNWHTHPKGQLLIVSEGSGLIQEWGKPVRKIQKGDVVWTPPGVKHWHGAGPKTSMAHSAISETDKGKSVDWMERVPNETYNTAPQ